MDHAPSNPPLITVIPLAAAPDGSPLARSLAPQSMPRWVLAPVPAGNSPLTDRLNHAIRSATTPFVYIASPEAVLAPTLLEKAFWFLATHPRYAFVNCHELRRFTGAQPTLHGRHFFDRDAVLHADQLGVHVLVRRSAFLDLHGFDASHEPAIAAWDFWLRAAETNQWGSTIAEPLVERPAGPDHGDPVPADIERHRPGFQQRFPRLFAGHFPMIEPRLPTAFEPIRDQPPASWSCPRTSADTRRMLMIVPWLRMGGADKFNLDLCSLLRKHGWELTIVCTAPGPNEWLTLFEQHTRDLFFPHLFLHWADYPVLIRSLIQSRKPDVVFISNSELGYHLTPYLRAFHPEPVYIDYVHMEEESWKSGGHARHSAGMHDQLDLTLVTSGYLREWMIRRGADSDRVVNCPIGVDARTWKPDPQTRSAVRRELRLAESAPVMLYAGRICPQKQPAVFARTIQQLTQRRRDFTALVAGSGEDLPWLERFVADHGLGGRVRFLGETSPGRTRDLMAASDIVFLPSQWEGVALVLYEAMATGALFVGADVGGHGEVATPETAVLLKPEPGEDPIHQAARYADAIDPLLADAQKRRLLTAAARRRIEDHYTLDHLEKNILAAIDLARRFQRTHPRQRLSAALGQEMAVRAIEFIRLEWSLGQYWREREYWRSAATSAGIEPARAPAQGRSAIRRVLKALRPSPRNAAGPDQR
ncbi:MAG: D-inositol-3-phosphate glycosyltransferase [Phycisphaerales bacterium]|nr:D-inositol-3-phosphate glycosyltransferase [Phycisphaerales bacterium]